mmetsp:Transcript_2700/g.8645  ORF Transcript_2700/g.8645 Transcript_2700/m.8645 type:complete len:301 (+) Transcript_2700:652-1554(+)
MRLDGLALREAAAAEGYRLCHMPQPGVPDLETGLQLRLALAEEGEVGRHEQAQAEDHEVQRRREEGHGPDAAQQRPQREGSKAAPEEKVYEGGAHFGHVRPELQETGKGVLHVRCAARMHDVRERAGRKRKAQQPLADGLRQLAGKHVALVLDDVIHSRDEGRDDEVGQELREDAARATRQRRRDGPVLAGPDLPDEVAVQPHAQGNDHQALGKLGALAWLLEAKLDERQEALDGAWPAPTNLLRRRQEACAGSLCGRRLWRRDNRLVRILLLDVIRGTLQGLVTRRGERRHRRQLITVG